jgi:hypothetical protein
VLTARVTDAGGRSAESAPVRVHVGPPVAALIRPGAVWKYHDQGVDLGTAWREPGFDDASWPAGPAPLGYGDHDESTVVGYGTNLFSRHITTYFRQSLEVPDPARWSVLRFRLLRDDGAVVYLNGNEVFRSNMPESPVGFATRALSAAVGGDESTNTFAATAGAALLVPGTNVVAVEVHQESPMSSDLSFDLECLAFPPGGLPALQIGGAGGGCLVRWPAWAEDWLLQAGDEPSREGLWTGLTNVAVRTNGSLQVELPRAPGGRFFQLVFP